MNLISKKAIGLLLAISVVISVTGCSANVVAKVNKENITKSQFNKSLDKQKKLMEMQGATIKAVKGDKMYEAVKKQVFDQMVDEILVIQAAEKEGVKPSDKEIDQEMQNIIKQNFKNEQEYKDILKQMNYTEKEMKDLKLQEISKTRLFEKVTKDVTVTVGEVNKYYDDNKAQIKGAKFRDILVATQDDANKIIADLKAGKDFNTLAKEKSQDINTKENGGLFTDKASKKEYWLKGLGLDQFFGKEVEDSIFNLKKGEYSQTPIVGNGGFYILKLEDIKQMNYDDSKEDIKLKLLNDKKSQKYEAYFADFKKKSDIKNYLN